MEKVGGYVIKPNSQQGEICYVNCQKTTPVAWIAEHVRYFSEQTKFNITLKDGTFDFKSPKIVGNATLYIVDDKSLPVLLVAPESRWAVVNVAPIAEEKRAAYFEARFKKELTRGFSYLCGAANSQFPRALTRGITRQEQMDVDPDYGLPIDVLKRFETYMKDLGVTPSVRVIYRKAVQEGWAPAPTNEFQKAVWDKVHATPQNPMKIEFDPKKGR